MNACMCGGRGGGSEVKVKAKFWNMTPFAAMHEFLILKVCRDMGPSL